MATTKSINVLVVEDNADAAWSLKELLERRTEVMFKVDTAETLQVAIEKLEKAKADAVLLDLHLPDAPPAESLVKLVKGIAPDVGLIALTGWQDDGTLSDKVKQAGADALLHKPVDAAEVSKKLQLSVIYRKAEAEKHELELVLEKLGQAMENVARATGDSGSFKFPKEQS